MFDVSLKGKGAIPRGDDPRNILYKDYIAGYTPVDWDTPFDIRMLIGDLPVNDQGTSSSCSGQSCSKLAEIAEAFESKQHTRLSARDVYSRVYVPAGGAYGYKALSTIVNRGVAPENVVSSYENGLPPNESFMRIQDNSPEATEKALIRKAVSYAYITENSIDELALAIKRQNGVVFGVVGTNWGWTGDRPAIPQPGEDIWYHFITGIGYKLIGGKKHITVLNSWGTGWGDNGYGYISEDYIGGGWMFNAMTLLDGINPPEKIDMKRVIKVADSNDQWLVEGSKRFHIPDAATLIWLRDELKVIIPVETVSSSDLESLEIGVPVPSVVVNGKVQELYNVLKDAFGEE